MEQLMEGKYEVLPQSEKFKGLGIGWLATFVLIGMVIGGLVGGLLGAFVPLPGGVLIGATVGLTWGIGLGLGIGLAAYSITNLFSERSKLPSVLGLSGGNGMIGAVIGSVAGSIIFPGLGNIAGMVIGAAIGLGATQLLALITYVASEVVTYLQKPKNAPKDPDEIKNIYGNSNESKSKKEDDLNSEPGNFPSPLSTGDEDESNENILEDKPQFGWDRP